eukprot:scaffold97_cov375-Prasinococcus_capsulatus_cf.AAC.8
MYRTNVAQSSAYKTLGSVAVTVLVGCWVSLCVSDLIIHVDRQQAFRDEEHKGSKFTFTTQCVAGEQAQRASLHEFGNFDGLAFIKVLEEDVRLLLTLVFPHVRGELSLAALDHQVLHGHEPRYRPRLRRRPWSQVVGTRTGLRHGVIGRAGCARAEAGRQRASVVVAAPRRGSARAAASATADGGALQRGGRGRPPAQALALLLLVLLLLLLLVVVVERAGGERGALLDGEGAQDVLQALLAAGDGGGADVRGVVHQHAAPRAAHHGGDRQRLHGQGGARAAVQQRRGVAARAARPDLVLRRRQHVRLLLPAQAHQRDRRRVDQLLPRRRR